MIPRPQRDGFKVQIRKMEILVYFLFSASVSYKNFQREKGYLESTGAFVVIGGLVAGPAQMAMNCTPRLVLRLWPIVYFSSAGNAPSWAQQCREAVTQKWQGPCFPRPRLWRIGTGKEPRPWEQLVHRCGHLQAWCTQAIFSITSQLVSCSPKYSVSTLGDLVSAFTELSIEWQT